MKISSLLLVALLGFALFTSFPTVRAEEDEVDDDDYEDTQKARIVFRKSVSEISVVQGRNVTILLQLFNIGESTASNILIKDFLPEEATLVSGSLTASFSKLASGSDAKHEYTVVFNKGNIQKFLPVASVTYEASSDEEVQAGRSSLQPVIVLTPLQQIQKYALSVGTYASLGFAKTPEEWRNLSIFFLVVGGFLGGNWAVKQYGTANANRKRTQALKEIEKMN